MWILKWQCLCDHHFSAYDDIHQTLQAKQKNLKRTVKAMDLSSDKFDLCNQTLTDLWNICPDNLAACQNSDRKFTPEVRAYAILTLLIYTT